MSRAYTLSVLEKHVSSSHQQVQKLVERNSLPLRDGVPSSGPARLGLALYALCSCCQCSYCPACPGWRPQHLCLKSQELLY